jgi:hypothetical protein
MQMIYEAPESTRRMIYQVAEETIVVEALDEWAQTVIEELFAGWYLNAAVAQDESLTSPAITIRSGACPPEIPESWPRFDIAGGGVCGTDDETSFIEIEGSIVAMTKKTVEVWMNGRLAIESEALTRIVTYALSAALRRRHLFELHSGAVIDPETGSGILIIGPSGSGKSTLTVQLAAAGWPFLTDDVLLLSAGETEVKAWPLRRCFAITSETFAASDFLRARTSLNYSRAEREQKKQFVPHDVFDAEFREHCAPRTLFFSELSGAMRSQAAPLSAAETMARLIRMNPWSCYDRATAADHLAVLSKLVMQCRGYALLAGEDLLNSETAAKLVASYTRP